MSQRRYHNTLTPIEPRPLLAQWPRFVQPVVSKAHFEAPMLVDDGDEANKEAGGPPARGSGEARPYPIVMQPMGSAQGRREAETTLLQRAAL